MSTPITVKILISLPLELKQYLEALKRLEGATTSGYIRQQLEQDMRGRLETNWNPLTGWGAIDNPSYQRRMRAAERRAGKEAERQIVKAASRILKQRTARPTPKKGGRP